MSLSDKQFSSPSCYGHIAHRGASSTQTTSFSLVCETEATVPIEVMVPSAQLALLIKLSYFHDCIVA